MAPAARAEPDAPLEAPLQVAAALADCGATLETRLHSGSVTDVYRGRLDGGRPVAIKLTWRPGAAALVAREHSTLAALSHPHIVRPLRFAARDDAAVLVLEYLSAGDLVSLAKEPPQRWAGAALAVASALAAVHDAGFVHGDLKARNVLFAAGGTPKLIDFGSALPIGRRRGAGGRTPAHEPLRFTFEEAAPEQDVYALAVLIYELAVGRLPFGPMPGAYAPPPPIPAATAAMRALSARIAAALAATEPAGVGTLLEFADVLESVRKDAADTGDRPPAGSPSAGTAR